VLALIARAGCSCASDTTVRWIVSIVLLGGGVAVLAGAWWSGVRAARAAGGSSSGPSPQPSSGGPSRRLVTCVGAGFVVLGLVVALAQLSASTSLLALVAAVGGTSAGVSVEAARRRRSEPSTGAGRPSPP
jgi:hypothetical protein